MEQKQIAQILKSKVQPSLFDFYTDEELGWYMIETLEPEDLPTVTIDSNF